MASNFYPAWLIAPRPQVFDGARRVADALRARDAAPALAWCGEQRARLKKAKSPLEFKLRLQEFVELLRKVRPGALKHG